MNLFKNWRKYNICLFLTETLRSLYYVKINHQQRKYVYRKKYGKRKKLSAQETNDFFLNSILSNKPFFAGRLGSAEMRRANRHIMIKLGLAKNFKPEHYRGALYNTPELAAWMSDQLLEVMPDVDIMPAWCLLAEPYIIRQFAKKAKISHFEDIEPFWYDMPWTSALKGKKVLVINPFDQSIRQQYEKRELLFENKNILPEFELHTLKSVMILSPEDNVYGTAVEAIDYMYNEAMKIDFDIALLGCGPMGMILADKFVKQGKQAVYLGGVLQMMFGIKGKRWDCQEKYANLYNEHWTYPVEELPKGAERLDSACYWK